MFEHQGIWLPDGEKHFPEWMDRNGERVDGFGTYQIRKFRTAMRLVENWRTAVDVGAHVGLWSMQMAKKFAVVHAFEPVAAFRECWVRNVQVGKAMMHPVALGEQAGTVSMKYDPADSGGTHVCGPGDVAMVKLDDMRLRDVDFVKIDCEGYEHKVIAGALETLRAFKPCVIVEQKPHKLGPNFGIKGTPAVDLLQSIGYQVRSVLSGDYILTV